jgi:ribosomal protein S18 acetylase RimI-like enzyme
VEWKEDGIGDIRGVAVDETHRRQGVANHLLDHVEQLARQRGTLKLECITAETENAPALSCFTNYGFQNLGFRGNYPNTQRAVRLSKPVR